MKTVLIYLINSLWDFVRGLKHNYNSPLEAGPKRLYYQIVIVSHTIEKGLSLENPRPGFGKQKIEQLIGLMDRYDGSLGDFPMGMARGALSKYVSHHRDLGIQDPVVDRVEAYVEASRAKVQCLETGGLKLIDGAVTGQGALDRRFSCRAYAMQKVAESQVREIVARAQRAPSQCNRQSTRVHCYQEPADIRRLLTLQGGSAGFVESVPNLFVVTSELAAWGGPGQRNQAYVDGSLFAMCLMLACVDAGLQCCPLNLAKTNRAEMALARAAGIPVDQRLIMMIAFGRCDLEPMKAAASPRLAPDEVLTLYPGGGCDE